MSTQLQARGEGLCPVNVEGHTDSLVAFLEREGYTDIRVVHPRAKAVKDSGSTSTRRTTTAPAARRVVTRRPRA